MLKYINAHKHNRSFSQAIIIMYSHIIFPIITTLYNTTLTIFDSLYVLPVIQFNQILGFFTFGFCL